MTLIRRLVVVDGVAQWFELDPEPKMAWCQGDQHAWAWIPASETCKCGAARVLEPAAAP